ncbi:LPS export ABC transporter permease LptG [Crenothrix polyspora]|uniref:Permease YjgP/YjgQ family protein n=1 Tax=Crenothrix polyspora TaxID=360316 RepID=A0A1R4HCI9_9GAMM|nr:LPS export ABC transporter permease LptG [Crenothrix polyspora]SJM93954.1 Permease YjgP/YjgQ family protein [Crenothrix polyspora]
MNVLTLYIVKEILKGSFVALVCLLTLFNLFTFSDELGYLGKNNYGLKEIFYYVALTSPTVIYELIPAAALLGSLFVLGNMANNRELIAMQSSGLAISGIVKSTLLAGAVLVTIAFLVGEFIAPLGERMGQKIKILSQNPNAIMHSRYGLWLRENNQFINVRRIQDDGKLANINLYEIDKQHHLHSATYAQQATFLGKQQWRLEQPRQSLVSSQQMHVVKQRQRLWQSSIDPQLFKMVTVDPNNLSLYDLATYVDFLQDNHQKSLTFELAFWGRIVNPLVTFVMLLISVPFVIGIKRGISAGSRIMIGVVIGMSFNIVDKIASHMGLIYEFNAPLVAIFPSALVLFITLAVIKKSY